MKKAFLLCLSICMIVSCKKDDSNPNQLLLNTNMEKISSSEQTWFNYGSGTGFDASWTNEQSFSPVYSLKISRTISDSGNFWYFGQFINSNIPVGHDLTLTAKIKGINLTGEGASIVIRCDGADPDIQFETTQGVIKIDGTFDWTTYTLNLAKVESNVTSIIVYLIFLPNTTGSVYFDDVTLIYN